LKLEAPSKPSVIETSCACTHVGSELHTFMVTLNSLLFDVDYSSDWLRSVSKP